MLSGLKLGHHSDRFASLMDLLRPFVESLKRVRRCSSSPHSPTSATCHLCALSLHSPGEPRPSLACVPETGIPAEAAKMLGCQGPEGEQELFAEVYLYGFWPFCTRPKPGQQKLMGRQRRGLLRMHLDECPTEPSTYG